MYTDALCKRGMLIERFVELAPSRRVVRQYGSLYRFPALHRPYASREEPPPELLTPSPRTTNTPPPALMVDSERTSPPSSRSSGEGGGIDVGRRDEGSGGWVVDGLVDAESSMMSSA